MAALTKGLVRNFSAAKRSCFSFSNNVKTMRCSNFCYTLRNSNPVGLPPRQLPCLQCAASPSRFLRWKSSASSTSVVEYEMPKDVVQKVESEMQSGRTRLFAVVYLCSQQFKVTTNDLIQIQQHIPADVGERICLKKVLLVGGDNFTLLGRPLLSPEQVRVEATVIEKTKSQKIVVFKMRKRTRYRNYHEKYADLSVLRINSIEVAPKVL